MEEETDKTIIDTVALLTDLQNRHEESREFCILYTALYISIRVLASGDYELGEKYMRWLVQFAKEVLNEGNLTIQ